MQELGFDSYDSAITERTHLEKVTYPPIKQCRELFNGSIEMSDTYEMEMKTTVMSINLEVIGATCPYGRFCILIK